MLPLTIEDWLTRHQLDHRNVYSSLITEEVGLILLEFATLPTLSEVRVCDIKHLYGQNVSHISFEFDHIGSRRDAEIFVYICGQQVFGKDTFPIFHRYVQILLTCFSVE
jgi:hypothetical protein